MDIQIKYPSARLYELLDEVKKMNKRLLKYGLIICVLSLYSCSASQHLRIAKRKDPSLFVTQIDTVRDTIYVKVPKIDTVFKYSFDTVEYWQDKVFIKYHYDTLTNDVFIEANCPDNEVITNNITTTETITIKPTLWESLQYSIYIIGGLIVVIGIKKIFF